METSNYELMLQFEAETLMDLFFEHYVKEYGERSCEEICQRVANSPRAQSYLTELTLNNSYPSPKETAVMINSITYFIFSKAETWCVAGIYILLIWKRQKWTPLFNKFLMPDEEQAVRKILAEFILECCKAKVHLENSFFSRFFTLLAQEKNERDGL